MAEQLSIADLQEHPHKRYNPLTGEWVVVSPHRTKRPWQGNARDTGQKEVPSYDPGCYLCPGNTRAGGETNPAYTETFSFINDFASLLADVPDGGLSEEGLFRAQTERGICKVICFSPRHDMTMARMSKEEIEQIVRLWIREYREISTVDFISYVQIFENRGEIMGCSQPHPHGQIWSNERIPDLPAKETSAQADYFRQNGRPLLLDYVESEIRRGERVIFQNDHFAVLVPFWAVWPYETIILPKRQIKAVDELTDSEQAALAEALKIMTVKFDNLFTTSFPYSMGLHNQPCDGADYPGWQFHIHFLPPLLRSATVKKFMVGYELLATPQRDLTAENSAATLRELSTIHYLDAARRDN